MNSPKPTDPLSPIAQKFLRETDYLGPKDQLRVLKTLLAIVDARNARLETNRIIERAKESARRAIP
jgi:hypothetical protein